MTPRFLITPIHILLLAIGLLASLPAQGVAPARVVRVAVFPHPPAIFLDEADQKVKGFYADMLREVAARESWELRFVPGTWAEGLDRVRQGEVDLVTSVAFTQERATFLDYGKEPSFTVWSLVYAHPRETVQSLLDLKDLRVGVMRNDVNGGNFRKLCTQFGIPITFVELGTFVDVMKAVESHQLDAGVTPNTFGYYMENRYRVTRTPVVVNPFPIYFAVAQGRNRELLDPLDRYLAESRTTPSAHAARVVDRWLSRNGSNGLPPWVGRALVAGLGALLLSLIAVLVFRRQVKRATVEIRALNEDLRHELEARKAREERILNMARGVAAPIGDAFFQELVRFLAQAADAPMAYIGEQRGEEIHVLAAWKDGMEIPPFRFPSAGTPCGEAMQGRPIAFISDLANCFPQDHLLQQEGFESYVGTPLRDEAGNVSGLMAILKRTPLEDPEETLGLLQIFAVRAMSELERRRREEERRNLERQVLHVQKLESLGVLAGGIAHDFNNLLTAMLGHMNVARVKLPGDSPVQKHLESVEKVIFRTADLTRQMLAYSGKGHFVVEVQDLNQLIHEMTHLLQVSLSKKVALALELSLEPLLVEADGAQLQQVVMNLVTNAGDAIGDREGTIRITTGHIQADEVYLAQTFQGQDLAPGTYVLLQVEDSGCGMAPEVLSRIFDPFFTTKTTGRGLGLSATLGILRGHRGGLRIYSEVGKGSVFKILLPAAMDELPAAPAAHLQPQSFQGCVLVVDDEPEVLQASTLLLETLGFEVVSATDGRHALELFDQTTKTFGFVLLDLTMPHMDGRETLREIRVRKPELPVILCSGYSEVTTARGDTSVHFLQKPFSLADLRSKVQEVLAQKAT